MTPDSASSTKQALPSDTLAKAQPAASFDDPNDLFPESSEDDASESSFMVDDIESSESGV